MSAVLTASLLLLGLGMMILMAATGHTYLRDGERSLQLSMNTILNAEMRLGHWYHAHGSTR